MIFIFVNNFKLSIYLVMGARFYGYLTNELNVRKPAKNLN